MNAEEAIQYIHSVSWKGSVLGLSRITELLRRMGDPQKKLRFVHIAGTNGKGSAAALTDSILRAADYKTGLFTSPYICCFNERIRINGENIPDALLVEITEYTSRFAEAMEDKPTEFELVTAIGMEAFFRTRCDVVVLEVGMGGELDSTNVIDAPEAAVIMNIGLEHTEILGDTLEKIASAKAGIIKPGGRVVAYRGEPEVERVITETCREKGAQLKFADFDSIRPLGHSLNGQQFDWGEFKGLNLRLLGEHQLKNAAVAIETALILRERGFSISDDAIRRGVAEARWPARFEVLSEEPLFILDGGHNPQCIAALAKNIEDYLPGRRLVFLLGVLADKDYPRMFDECAYLAERFVTVTPNSPRALPSAELAKFLERYGKPVNDCQSVAAGVAEALAECPEGAAVCAFGSLYMAGEIRAQFT